MKNTKKIILGTSLFLALGASSASAETYELWAKGVTKERGWVDFNKDPVDSNDNSLCWAAAASNIIHWWQRQYEIPEYVPQGDKIWETFKTSFTNGGSNPYLGFLWWFDGTYYSPGDDAAKLKPGAYAAYYPDEDCIGDLMNEYDEQCAFILDSLSNGWAMTLGLSFGHEVTLWGIELDTSSNEITRLWVTDSDDYEHKIFSLECDKYVYSYGQAYLGIRGYPGKANDHYHAKMLARLETATTLQPIPEPSAVGLLAGLGALALVASRRRRK